MWNEILFCEQEKKKLQSLQFMTLVAFTIHFKARCNVLFDFIYLFIHFRKATNECILEPL